LGLLLAFVVTVAHLDDASAAPEAMGQWETQPLTKLKSIYADGKYQNHAE
jgi:hypothetical protein